MVEITVILPVYNCAAYVALAIESILNQTFTNFELLIIDDASTDHTLKIVKSYTDERIRWFTKEKNSGQVDSLNFGIEHSKGKYVAIMHGDDYSLPERLAAQFEFMEAHPEIGLCGSWYRIMNEATAFRLPLTHDELKLQLIFTCPFSHPTVMLRRATLEQKKLRYQPGFTVSEDYDLWIRMAAVTTMANVPEILLEYRDHPAQASKNWKRMQIEVFDIRNRYLKILFPDNSFEYPFSVYSDELNTSEQFCQSLSKKVNDLEMLESQSIHLVTNVSGGFKEYLYSERKRAVLKFIYDKRTYSFKCFWFTIKKFRLIVKEAGFFMYLKYCVRVLNKSING